MAATQPSPAEIKKLVQNVRSVDEVDPYAKVLAYGVNGSGKTRLAASGPKCLIIDILEEGTRSTAGQSTGAKRIPVGTWDQIGMMYWYLKSGKHRYETVSLDTITAMQEVAMNFVLGEAEERDPTRERSMPDKRSYGRAATLMRGMIIAYRNLPMHVIFTAQERVIRDEDTGETVEITVDLPAGSRGTAMGCVGVLGRMTPRKVKVRPKDGGKRREKWVDLMQVGPSEVVRTKDRTFALGDVLQRPTMPKIIEAWNNIGEDEEEDEE